MAVATKNSLFLHIPKTGGVFIKHALFTAGIKCFDIGGQHDHFPKLLKMRPTSFFEDRLIYSFVRHPISWYQSRWTFRVQHGWQPRHLLDYHCASNNFQEFIINVLNFKPDGWCTFLFDQYLKNDQQIVNQVGRTEYLVDDLLRILKMANEEIDEDVVRSIPLANNSCLDGKGSKYWAKYTPELYFRMMAVESNTIQEYYHDIKLDPNKFIGNLPYEYSRQDTITAIKA